MRGRGAGARRATQALARVDLRGRAGALPDRATARPGWCRDGPLLVNVGGAHPPCGRGARYDVAVQLGRLRSRRALPVARRVLGCARRRSRVTRLGVPVERGNELAGVCVWSVVGMQVSLWSKLGDTGEATQEPDLIPAHDRVAGKGSTRSNE